MARTLNKKNSNKSIKSQRRMAVWIDRDTNTGQKRWDRRCSETTAAAFTRTVNPLSSAWQILCVGILIVHTNTHTPNDEPLKEYKDVYMWIFHLFFWSQQQHWPGHFFSLQERTSSPEPSQGRPSAPVSSHVLKRRCKPESHVLLQRLQWFQLAQLPPPEK